MSRPVGEPSVPLRQVQQGYGIRQLQRRPTVTSQLADFGVDTKEVYLPRVGHGPANCNDAGIGPDMSYALDAAAPAGGYVTRGTPAINSYFEFDILLAPQGGIFGLHYIWGIGPDYGKFTVSVASLLYQSELRPSGCSEGKIEPCDLAYGVGPTFMNMTQQDAYNAAPAYDILASDIVWIIGGNVGDPLTDFSDVGNPCADNAGNDPFSGYNIWNGGPGWYRIRIQVTSKNASSSDYRCRIARFAVMRLNDTGTT